MALYLAQMIEQHGRERIAVGKPEKAGEPLKLLALIGQRMGLLVGHHLQPVLDLAQEAVRLSQVARRLAGDPAALGEVLQRDQGLPAAQFGMPAARDQLLGLHEEFDLADAAASELDVVPFDRDLVVALVGRHLALHRVHVGDRAVVEILAPHEGRDLAQERLAEREIAGAGARLDHRGALPVLSGALVVVQRRGERDRDWRRGGIGTQPQIGAEHVAVDRALLHQLDEAARDAGEEAAGFGAFERRCVRVVEHDQVDIAGVVQFERPALAHGKNDVAAALLGIGRIRDLELARHTAQQMTQRAAERRIGEFGERGGDALDRPDATDIGKGDQERSFGLRAAQDAHRVGLTGGLARAARIREHGCETLLRLGLEDCDKAIGVCPDQIPQIGRAFRNRSDQIGELRFWRSKERLQGLAGRSARNLAEPLVDACTRLFRRRKPRRSFDGRRKTRCRSRGLLGGAFGRLGGHFVNSTAFRSNRPGWRHASMRW